MAGPADSSATPIGKYAKAFARKMTQAAAGLLRGGGDVPEVIFRLDPTPDPDARTPAEQAARIVAGQSAECWSVAMADASRAIVMRVSGRNRARRGAAEAVFAAQFDDFRKEWGVALKTSYLRNAAGRAAWRPRDPWRVHLLAAKIPGAAARAHACLEEYVSLTREQGQKKNTAFEAAYAAQLKPLIDAADKDKGKGKGNDTGKKAG